MKVEPWLRGTLTEYDAVRRQVLHALELAGEDVDRWCWGLSDAEMGARPFGIAPVAFHLRHIARSLDRLLTYAEGRQLTDGQLEALGSELAEPMDVEQVMEEFWAGLRRAAERIAKIAPETFEHGRGVGRGSLPSTVGGLLVHCAEHTQRHSGQAITTARVVRGLRETEDAGVSRSHALR